MRTTLTIDSDMEGLLREEMKRSGRSMEDVLIDALWIGLRARTKTPWEPYRVEPHAFHFKPHVDTDRLNQLADELEAEDQIEALRR